MDFGEQELGFKEVDRRYAELKRLHEAGSITEEEFDNQLMRLMIQDQRGRWWAKTRKSGQWHYYDGKTWARGNTHGLQSTPQATSSTKEHISDYQQQFREQAWWRRKEVLGAIVVVFAGATWIVGGFVIAVGLDSLIIGTTVLALVGTLVGLIGLRVQQLASYRGLATIGFLVTFISTAYMLISVLASLPINPADNSLGTQVFIGSLLMCLGLILIGVAYLQSRALPLWASTALIIGMILYILLGIVGDVVGYATGAPTIIAAATAADDYLFGCIWLVLGYAIWLRWRVANS